jgi:hypothetical protein
VKKPYHVTSGNAYAAEDSEKVLTGERLDT